MNSIHLDIAGNIYRLGRAVDLSIPLDFAGPQPNAYGVPPAASTPYSGDGFMLDTRRGGSCNCDVLTIAPHCNGTHTESVGHLTRERFPVNEVMTPLFLASTLISVQPDGRAITADCLEIVKYDLAFCEALIVRTLPNGIDKKTRRWENDTTPYFTPDAMAVIRDLGVNHLLVDLPSLDPLYDDGKLAAHRVFWGLPPGESELAKVEDLTRTVTEMIFVPDRVPDGRYVLNLQLPRFVSDAAPSRPVLYFLEDRI